MSAKKERWVVGHHAVLEAIQVRPKDVTKVYLEGKDHLSPLKAELKKLAEKKNISVSFQEAGWFRRLAQVHQGVAASVRSEPSFDWNSVDSSNVWLGVAVDQLEDPQNLGAIIRSSWLLNAKAVFADAHRSTDLTPSVCKAASGGAEHVPLVKEGNLVRSLQTLQDSGVECFALTADEQSESLWDIEIPPKICWIIGSEESGIRKTVLNICQRKIWIPQTNVRASLNASVSAAVVLSETWRQHLSISR